MLEVTRAERHLKPWGYEDWIVNNDKYCAKILHFDKGRRFSLHFHLIKHETWYVVRGALILVGVDTKTAEKYQRSLYPGDVVVVAQGEPHRLIAVQDTDIFEASTTHFEEDSYRIEPGDSQK